jgi:hypothetical protein
MTTSKQCFDLFKRSPKEFLRPFVTVDETWIHHYTAEMDFTRQTGTKEQRRQRQFHWPERSWPTVFWDSKGIIFIAYLERGRTITGQYFD